VVEKNKNYKNINDHLLLTFSDENSQNFSISMLVAKIMKMKSLFSGGSLQVGLMILILASFLSFMAWLCRDKYKKVRISALQGQI
jgi:hypothetical protein